MRGKGGVCGKRESKNPNKNPKIEWWKEAVLETWDGEQNYMKKTLEINLEILDIFNEVHVLVHLSVYIQEWAEVKAMCQW